MFETKAYWKDAYLLQRHLRHEAETKLKQWELQRNPVVKFWDMHGNMCAINTSMVITVVAVKDGNEARLEITVASGPIAAFQFRTEADAQTVIRSMAL